MNIFKKIFYSIKELWLDLVYDDVSNKTGHKKFMAIISFLILIVLILGNAFFGTELNIISVTTLIAMTGVNSAISAVEKIKLKKEI